MLVNLTHLNGEPNYMLHFFRKADIITSTLPTTSVSFPTYTWKSGGIKVIKLQFWKIPWCVRPVVCPGSLQTVKPVLFRRSSFTLPPSEALGLSLNRRLSSIISLGCLNYIHIFNFEVMSSISFHLLRRQHYPEIIFFKL